MGGSGWQDADIDTLLTPSISPFAPGSTLGIDTTNGRFSYSGSNMGCNVTGGSVALLKLGANTLTLTGPATYAGGTTVAVGTLEAAAPAACRAVPARAVTISVVGGAVLAVSAGGPGWQGTDIDTLLTLPTSPFAPGSALGIDTTNGSFSYAGTNIGVNVAETTWAW